MVGLRGKRMNNKSFGELKELVLEWAEDKDLLHSDNAEKQFMKFIEEVFEFKWEMHNLINYKKYCEERAKRLPKHAAKNMKDEMGDIFVTLIVLCNQLGIDCVECLEMAYEKISKRKGKTIDGTFVKEEDL